jgi:aminoglycoside phosphotransferase (APT) family kinase protein
VARAGIASILPGAGRTPAQAGCDTLRAIVLDLADVAGYLLERDLLDPRAVVEGGLRVQDLSRRNRVFLVTAATGRCFVLKAAAGAGDGGVAREAAVLERLRDAAPAAALAAFLPALVAFDEAAGVLVLEAAPAAQDLARVHAAGRFPLTLARAAGRALALVHDLPGSVLGDLEHVADPLWALRVHRPDLDRLWRLSAAAADLVRIVQRDGELCGELDRLRAAWQEPSVVHGDVRWDNCLALPRGRSARRTRLVLIDWELSVAGDPAADVGGFLGDYLRAWLRSIPIVDPLDPALLLAHARLPLRRMRPAIAAFWDGYARTRRQAPGDLSRTLRRATRFAAVRLLAASFEEAQTRAILPATLVHQQQLSLHILRRPDEAAAQLLGLAPSWAAA